VGSVNDNQLLSQLLKNPKLSSNKIREVMQKSFPIIDASENIEMVSRLINKENPAVLVRELSGTIHILTKYDLIGALSFKVVKVILEKSVRIGVNEQNTTSKKMIILSS